MIAAGEVVQRPASVVKELMENAIDAGAGHVSVLVRDAGKTLVQVIDDGCGMSPDDAVVCFERHATSKIASKEDLQSIMTFGFRGEALASIAAVSEVTLNKSRHSSESIILAEIIFPVLIECLKVNEPVGPYLVVSHFTIRSPQFHECKER